MKQTGIKIKGYQVKNNKLVKSKTYYPSVSAALKAKDKKRYRRRGTT